MPNTNGTIDCLAANTPSGITFLRTSVICKRRGRSRSSHFADIKAGLFVKPVLIGLRATGTPDNEVDCLIAARIAGKSDEEIRSLVVKLEVARKTLAYGVHHDNK